VPLKNRFETCKLRSRLRRGQLFMPHSGHCRDETATAQSGGEPICKSVTASSAAALAISRR
jgi:hypothetical protein